MCGIRCSLSGDTRPSQVLLAARAVRRAGRPAATPSPHPKIEAAMAIREKLERCAALDAAAALSSTSLGAPNYQTMRTPTVGAKDEILGSRVTSGKSRAAALARMWRSQGSRCSHSKAAAAQAMGAVTGRTVKPRANLSSQSAGSAAVVSRPCLRRRAVSLKVMSDM